MSKAKRLAALLLSGLLLIGPAGCHKEPQKPEGSSGATTAATAGSGTDASADTDASGEVTGGADTSTTSKPGIIRRLRSRLKTRRTCRTPSSRISRAP